MERESKKAIYKLITLGEPSVGKSCFLRQFVSGEFTEHHISTVGVDSETKDIQVGNDTVSL